MNESTKKMLRRVSTPQGLELVKRTDEIMKVFGGSVIEARAAVLEEWYGPNQRIDWTALAGQLS